MCVVPVSGKRQKRIDWQLAKKMKKATEVHSAKTVHFSSQLSKKEKDGAKCQCVCEFV